VPPADAVTLEGWGCPDPASQPSSCTHHSKHHRFATGRHGHMSSYKQASRGGSKASVTCNKGSLSCVNKQDSNADEDVTGLQAVRGKKTKVAKAKAKYADQDEEDRELAMQFLGAAGESQAFVNREC